MAGARYPFEILPIEIWEMIILEVKDSEDLRNLMKASKQLNNAFLKIHHFWLLDKVLPFLMPTPNESKRCLIIGDVERPRLVGNLEMEDLKSLRLIDKRWCRAVGAYLENQPDLRPYNKSDDKLNSEDHIWTESCLKLEEDREFKNGSVNFSDYSQMSKFRRVFKNSKRNPFPSRSIVGCTKNDVAVYGGVEDEKDTFWGEMNREVFKKFGKHIWFLKMQWGDFDFDEDDLESYDANHWELKSVWKGIVNSLSSLPNLKGFHFKIDNIKIEECPKESGESTDFLKLSENKLPQMEFLESLRIQDSVGLPDQFVKQLVSNYYAQLRRIEIPVGDWMEEKWVFPNLTELHLARIDSDMDGKYLLDVLPSLRAPQLLKLELTGTSYIDVSALPHFRVEEDIFKWIDLFPSLLYLNISCKRFVISESGALQVPRDSKLGLKYLKIRNLGELTWNFLRCLPNLERLQICIPDNLIDWPSDSIKGKPKLCVDRSLYELNVWEILPKLRTFSLIELIHWGEEKYIEFHRTTYENLKSRVDPAERANLRYGISSDYDLHENYQ